VVVAKRRRRTKDLSMGNKTKKIKVQQALMMRKRKSLKKLNRKIKWRVMSQQLTKRK